jgi:integrase
MGLRTRDGKWHYRFEVDGHEWTGSTGLAATERNRRAAERVELEARQAVEQGKSHLLRIQAIPFNEAAQKFLAWCEGHHRAKPNTYKRVKTSFASLEIHFGRTSVSAVTTGDVADYSAWRANTHKVKDVTIRHDLHNLSKFFQYAVKHNWRRDNPVSAEDIPSDADAVRIHVFTPAEESAYFHAAHPRLQDLARLMVYQGCRPEELLSARLAAVDLDRAYLRIEKSKTNAGERTLRIRPESSLILARLVQSGDGPWLFPSERSSAKKLSLSTCENWHVKVRTATGIPCVIYDWRHTFATRAANAGMSLATLKDILGHSSLRSVMKYVHPTQQDQDRAMEMLSRPAPQPDGNRTRLSEQRKIQ